MKTATDANKVNTKLFKWNVLLLNIKQTAISIEDITVMINTAILEGSTKLNIVLRSLKGLMKKVAINEMNNKKQSNLSIDAFLVASIFSFSDDKNENITIRMAGIKQTAKNLNVT